MSISPHTTAFRRLGFALALLLLAANLVGCVERRMTIRSNPPGAQVYVDDYSIGTTPASVSYTYYGTRKIRLVKDGYETLTVYQTMPAPWYDFVGVDFFSENLWPHKIRDERNFDYQMSPIIMVPTEELKSRAEQLRSASIIQAAAQAPVVASPPGIAAGQIPPPVGAPPMGVAPMGAAPFGTAPMVNAGPQTFPQADATPISPVAPLNAPALAPQTLPPGTAPGTFAPPGNYPPPGGYGPPTGYPAPGAYPAPSPLPPPPSAAPSTGPLFNQPVVPPGWRPISEAPTPLQR
jgi:hypothetical protein